MLAAGEILTPHLMPESAIEDPEIHGCFGCMLAFKWMKPKS